MANGGGSPHKQGKSEKSGKNTSTAKKEQPTQSSESDTGKSAKSSA